MQPCLYVSNSLKWGLFLNTALQYIHIDNFLCLYLDWICSQFCLYFFLQFWVCYSWNLIPNILSNISWECLCWGWFLMPPFQTSDFRTVWYTIYWAVSKQEVFSLFAALTVKFLTKRFISEYDPNLGKQSFVYPPLTMRHNEISCWFLPFGLHNLHILKKSANAPKLNVIICIAHGMLLQVFLCCFDVVFVLAVT